MDHIQTEAIVADIDIERKKGGGIWPWILGLLLLGLLAWGLSRCSGDDADDSAAVPVTDTAVAPSAVAPAPLPPVDPAAPADSATVAAGTIPVAQIVANPAQFAGQPVSGTARVVEVVSDRGFWIEEEGQRMFTIIAEPQAAEGRVNIEAGQTLQLSGSVKQQGAGAAVPTNLEEETRRLAEQQPAFLVVHPRDVSVVSGGTR